MEIGDKVICKEFGEVEIFNKIYTHVDNGEKFASHFEVKLNDGSIKQVSAGLLSPIFSENDDLVGKEIDSKEFGKVTVVERYIDLETGGDLIIVKDENGEKQTMLPEDIVNEEDYEKSIMNKAFYDNENRYHSVESHSIDDDKKHSVVLKREDGKLVKVDFENLKKDFKTERDTIDNTTIIKEVQQQDKKQEIDVNVSIDNAEEIGKNLSKEFENVVNDFKKEILKNAEKQKIEIEEFDDSKIISTLKALENNIIKKIGNSDFLGAFEILNNTVKEVKEEIVKQDINCEINILPIVAKLEKIQEALESIPEFEFPQKLLDEDKVKVALDSKFISDDGHRIKVEVDRVGGDGKNLVGIGGSGGGRIKNKDGSLVNPATEEKQDDIITALGGSVDDYKEFEYVNNFVKKIIFKNGGSNGSVIKTLTFDYDSDYNVISITKT